LLDIEDLLKTFEYRRQPDRVQRGKNTCPDSGPCATEKQRPVQLAAAV
jgi:hypothetical protein